MNVTRTRLLTILSTLFFTTQLAGAQVAPTASELTAYRGLHAAAAKGDATEIERLVKAGAPIDARQPRAHAAAYCNLHAET